MEEYVPTPCSGMEEGSATSLACSPRTVLSRGVQSQGTDFLAWKVLVRLSVEERAVSLAFQAMERLEVEEGMQIPQVCRP